MAEKLVMTKSNEATIALFGAFDSNVRMVERAFDVRIANGGGAPDSGDVLVVTGDTECVDKAAAALEYMKRMIGDGETLSEQSVFLYNYFYLY